MTFQITRGTASYYAGNPEFPDFPWLVEKTLRPGETYTIGMFLKREDAERCLWSLRGSIEASRGATIREELP